MSLENKTIQNKAVKYFQQLWNFVFRTLDPTRYKQFLSMLDQLQEKRHDPEAISSMINTWRSELTSHRAQILDVLSEAVPSHSAATEVGSPTHAMHSLTLPITEVQQLQQLPGPTANNQLPAASSHHPPHSSSHNQNVVAANLSAAPWNNASHSAGPRTPTASASGSTLGERRRSVGAISQPPSILGNQPSSLEEWFSLFLISR